MLHLATHKVVLFTILHSVYTGQATYALWLWPAEISVEQDMFVNIHCSATEERITGNLKIFVKHKKSRKKKKKQEEKSLHTYFMLTLSNLIFEGAIKGHEMQFSNKTFREKFCVVNMVR